MLNKKTPLIAESNWIPTYMHLPSDGQLVLVRYNPAPRAVVFRRYPELRWERDGTLFRFEHFDQWALISPGASS
jgi:hypothetical protein